MCDIVNKILLSTFEKLSTNSSYIESILLITYGKYSNVLLFFTCFLFDNITLLLYIAIGLYSSISPP